MTPDVDLLVVRMRRDQLPCHSLIRSFLFHGSVSFNESIPLYMRVHV